LIPNVAIAVTGSPSSISRKTSSVADFSNNCSAASVVNFVSMQFPPSLLMGENQARQELCENPTNARHFGWWLGFTSVEIALGC